MSEIEIEEKYFSLRPTKHAEELGQLAEEHPETLYVARLIF